MRRPLTPVLLIVTLSACGGGAVPPATPDPRPTLGDVSEADWRRLSARRIYFGHQSVGGNVVAGISEVLAANPQVRLSVVETKDLAATTGPGFYHARVGRNGDPASKADEFASIAGRGMPDSGGVGMLKYCYVDIFPTTDPQALFADYKRRMAALRAAHPGLTLVHFTLPLTLSERTSRYLVKRMLGRRTTRDLNVIRNVYNALLRAEYEGKEPVFDLARLESTRLDGTRTYFTRGPDTVYVMAPDLTTDGGHLNEPGRRAVAEQLLIFLARLQ